jgi:DNA-directed RNA polymerase I and III subunit RPAC2
MEEPKLQLLPGGSDTSCTFVLSREDHTLGNALRFVCMRDARTQFCGYSMPHPSEQVVNLRLQTAPPATSVDVFSRGLQTLADICEHIEASLGAAQAPAAAEEGGAAAGGGGGGGGGAAAAAAEADEGEEGMGGGGGGGGGGGRGGDAAAERPAKGKKK